MIRYYRRILLICVILLVLVLLHWSGITNYFTLEQLQLHAATLHSYVDTNYCASVFVYCACFIAATILFLPITILLTMLGGYLFGVIPGLFYATTSATLGGIFLFVLVRYLLGDLVQRLFWQQVERFRHEIQLHGYSYLLMLQLLPITPTFVINIIAGLLPISLWTFGWTTFVGIFPGSLLYAIAGQQLGYVHAIRDILSWPMIGIFIALSLFSLFIPYVIRYMGFSFSK